MWVAVGLFCPRGVGRTVGSQAVWVEEAGLPEPTGPFYPRRSGRSYYGST